MDTNDSHPIEPPEVTDAQREEARRVVHAYDEERPTAVLPGSGGTVTGTAVNDWLDDDGKPIYGRSDDA
jgi:hypothetical protein